MFKIFQNTKKTLNIFTHEKLLKKSLKIVHHSPEISSEKAVDLAELFFRKRKYV